MGLIYIDGKVENHATGKAAVVPKMRVDSGSVFTWVEGRILERLGIERRKKDLKIQMANGEVITRSVGYAVLRVEKSETIDEVVFAEPGDPPLLGCRALEGLHLRIDSRAKRLIASGPSIAATAIKLRW